MMLHFIGFMALRLIGVAFAILLVMRIVAGVRSRRGGELEVLKRRLAAGEITEEQFRKLKDTVDS